MLDRRQNFYLFNQAHDAAVSKLSWAHPEFGPIIASSSFDRTVKVWERSSTFNRVRTRSQQNEGGNAAQPPSSSGSSNSRWTEIAVFLEAKGTVRAVEFAPHHFGLKLVSSRSSHFVTFYSLSTWNCLTSKPNSIS
jgi:nucleoporin SEH1